MDRFYKKLQARQSIVDERRARQESRTSPDRPIAELGIGTRPTEALAAAGITTAGQVMERLTTGDDALLAVEGFGRKSLIDLKKRLRQLGYQVPEATETAA
ncbi:MAG TPA: DNA-directed RNA polymerase subunit alpha C-terminal domain-containing protein [Anaerolineaceae bacterium]